MEIFHWLEKMGCGKAEKKSEQRIGNTEWVVVFKDLSH